MSDEKLDEEYFRQRIGFNGDLGEVSKNICKEFNIGEFIKYKICLVGYEDFNLSLETTKGKFFVKIFNQSKTLQECQDSLEILLKIANEDISTPKLYQTNQNYLYTFETNGQLLRICVMDLIDGVDLFSSQTSISRQDMLEIVHQAARINSVDIQLRKSYDSWAIVNFESEFKEKSQYLESTDLKLVKPLLGEFKNIQISKLPHCFVHGDLIRTNIIKDHGDKIWIIDFSVSNYYPRIIEFAVLACDVLFDRNDKSKSEENLNSALEEYQKSIKLEKIEIEFLPIFIKLAHAMNLLGSNFSKKIDNNNSKENEYFLTTGRAGLIQMS